MKRANPVNENTRHYWNDVYGTPEKREGYAAAGTSHDHGAGPMPSQQQTTRFSRALSYVRSGDKVLDLGCGVGVFTKMVRDSFENRKVYGADISDLAMEDNRREHPGITYVVNEIGRERLPYENYFDVVFSGETLEHLDDPKDLLRDAFHYLKPGGLLIITTPNNDAIRSPEHTWYFKHEDVEDLYRDAGFLTPDFVYLPRLEHLMVIFAVGRKP